MKTGRRRFLYVFEDFIDKLHYIGILPNTSLTIERNKIESEEADKWLNIASNYFRLVFYNISTNINFIIR